jgi:hypothetical protein
MSSRLDRLNLSLDPFMMKFSASLIASFLILAAAVGTARGGDFYVSPQGDDANSGTLAKPLASLAKARDAVRTARKTDKTAMTVYLREGTHYLAEPLVLEAADSGTAQAPVVYTAYMARSEKNVPLVN